MKRKEKEKIINALENKKFILIKICKAQNKECYNAEIGDGKDMDMSGCKGSTGLLNFSIEDILSEVEDEMRSLQ